MKAEEILKKALELEMKAIETYIEMRKSASPEIVDILDYLIMQEREHAKIINDRLKVIKLLSKEGEK